MGSLFPGAAVSGEDESEGTHWGGVVDGAGFAGSEWAFPGKIAKEKLARNAGRMARHTHRQPQRVSSADKVFIPNGQAIDSSASGRWVRQQV